MDKITIGLDVWVVSENVKFLLRRGFVQSIITEKDRDGESVKYRIKLSNSIIVTAFQDEVFPVSDPHGVLCRIESIVEKIE